MTPAATNVRIDPAELVGKHYYMAVFDAGFAPGVDLPRHFKWGKMDESLKVSWTTPQDLEDGPYDVVFVVYRSTEVPEDVVGAEIGVVAIDGDLASFTISTQDVLENDPPLTAGVLRVNLLGENTTKYAANRWTDDLSDEGAGALAFTDTILLVP